MINIGTLWNAAQCLGRLTVREKCTAEREWYVEIDCERTPDTRLSVEAPTLRQGLTALVDWGNAHLFELQFRSRSVWRRTVQMRDLPMDQQARVLARNFEGRYRWRYLG